MARKTNKRPWWLWSLVALAAAALVLGIWAGVRWIVVQQAHTPAVAYDPGVWFELAPEGGITAEGEPFTTRMRVGSENKVIVFFYGGGISINEYTAARPYLGLWIDREPGFYSADTEGQIPDYCELGIGSTQKDNPFRDWTVIVIPYTTADFHIGDGTYEYTALDGTRQTLHHHGYRNYRAIMDQAAAYTGSAPEELLVAGWSAGGYGAAILTDDLVTNYFPGAEHVTVCVDSSLLVLDDWTGILRDVWNVPEEIADQVRTGNLIVDFLGHLYETYGDRMTFLYVGSVRDGALAKYQAYFDTGVYAAGNRVAWVYTNYLRGMVRQLRESVPTIGIYLFDQLPYSWNPFMSRLTQHTILETRTAYWRLTAGRSVIRWLDEAINGRVETVGLEKLR